MVKKKSTPKKRTGGPLKRKFKKEIDERRKRCFKKLRRCLRTFKQVKKDQASIFPEPIQLARFGKKLLSGAKSLAKEAIDISNLPNVKLPANNREAAVKFVRAIPQALAPEPTQRARDPGSASRDRLQRFLREQAEAGPAVDLPEPPSGVLPALGAIGIGAIAAEQQRQLQIRQ